MSSNLSEGGKEHEEYKFVFLGLEILFDVESGTRFISIRKFSVESKKGWLFILTIVSAILAYAGFAFDLSRDVGYLKDSDTNRILAFIETSCEDPSRSESESEALANWCDQIQNAKSLNNLISENTQRVDRSM